MNDCKKKLKSYKQKVDNLNYDLNDLIGAIASSG